MEQVKEKSSKLAVKIVAVVAVLIIIFFGVYYAIVCSGSVSLKNTDKIQSVIVSLIGSTGDSNVEILKTELFENQQGNDYCGVLYKTSDGFGAEIFEEHKLFKNRYVPFISQNGAEDYSCVVNCRFDSKKQSSDLMMIFFGSNTDGKAALGEITLNDQYIVSATDSKGIVNDNFIYFTMLTVDGQVENAILTVYDENHNVLREETCGGSFEY